MFVGALAIAVVFAYFGITIMESLSSFITLILGGALIGSGLMLLFFVIKFLFKRTRTDYSGMMEITEQDQPQLFEFIRQLTAEAKAPFPKRMFLSADVNAGVFYNSSFWSMFFPVKKNLKIGLGLVNSLNVSEFKAVMAHEFGHFSQRSMKFGSYVYNLNKVIHNMLYDNDRYGRLINSFARMHALFRLFAWINIKIVEGMQQILKGVYVVLNKTYLGLSRQMEFHADAVAAYVSGSNQMVSSLQRTNIGQLCYTGLINYWNTQLGDNKRSANFYPQQLEMLRHFSRKHNLLLDDAGLPVITNGIADLIGGSQLVINDQWSSHPSNDDRTISLERINLITPTVTEPAWLLFKNAEQLQLQLTDSLYASAKLDNDIAAVDLEGFKADFYSAIDKNSFNSIYKGYYDERGINAFDIDEAIINPVAIPSVGIDELLSDTNCSLPRTAETMQQDMATLDTLIDVRKDIKTFDYKGVKYKSTEAQTVRNLIEKERLHILKNTEELDKSLFIYYYKNCKTEVNQQLLAGKYRNLFKYQAEAIKDYDLYNNIMSVFSKVYNSMTAENIHSTVNTVYNHEQQLKPRIQEIIADEETRSHINEDELKAIDKYLKSKWVYYYEPSYDNEAIGIFNAGVGNYISAVAKRNFELKKDLLNFQTSLA